jgi:hypothetical protein
VRTWYAISFCSRGRSPASSPPRASYALALEFYEIARQRLAAAGVSDPGDVDVFSALVNGLSHQQVANDPGGDRWVRLAERAVDMFLADVDRRGKKQLSERSTTMKQATIHGRGHGAEDHAPRRGDADRSSGERQVRGTAAQL